MPNFNDGQLDLDTPPGTILWHLSFKGTDLVDKKECEEVVLIYGLFSTPEEAFEDYFRSCKEEGCLPHDEEILFVIAGTVLGPATTRFKPPQWGLKWRPDWEATDRYHSTIRIEW